MLAFARLGRWPRPLGLFGLELVAAMVGSLWRPGIVAFALVWAIAAATLVLDARLRGRRGVVAGLFGVALGPLGCVVISFGARRAVRKVGPRFRGAVARAVVAGVLGGVVAAAGGYWAIDRVGSTAFAPASGMAPRIAKGDLIVISPGLETRVRRGDIVAVSSFPGARHVRRRGRIVGVGRVVGLPGDWVGATSQGLYICVSAPDITADVSRESGCLFPDEPYTSSATPPFGPVQVPADSYYVLGDDRQVVTDSRLYGAVPASAVAGRVVAVIWPPSRIALR